MTYIFDARITDYMETHPYVFVCAFIAVVAGGKSNRKDGGVWNGATEDLTLEELGREAHDPTAV